MANNKIDYKFIADREGGRKTTGYVPAAAVSSSGVTIATGFDLGCRDEAELRRMMLPSTLVAKLKPYLGKKKKEAQDYIHKHKLTITDQEAEQIDIAVKSAQVDSLTRKYDTAPGNQTRFINLPAEAQTVIASVAFQYGANLEVKAPKFWKAATAQDWQGCVTLLNNFGDAYSTRRRLEAKLLERIVK